MVVERTNDVYAIGCYSGCGYLYSRLVLCGPESVVFLLRSVWVVSSVLNSLSTGGTTPPVDSL